MYIRLSLSAQQSHRCVSVISFPVLIYCETSEHYSDFAINCGGFLFEVLVKLTHYMC